MSQSKGKHGRNTQVSFFMGQSVLFGKTFILSFIMQRGIVWFKKVLKLLLFVTSVEAKEGWGFNLMPTSWADILAVLLQFLNLVNRL